MRSPHVFCLAIFALMTYAGRAAAYDHAVCESVSLDGEWEMAYRPYAYETVACPQFSGVKVPDAVPGYWEDMVDRFRASGMTDEFRINPWHEEQAFPIFGSAQDLTLPQIYGTFLYRKIIELNDSRAAFLSFEGVRNQVYVWINGRYVDFHAGISTPFELSVPEGFLRNGTNEVVLAVSNGRILGYSDYVCGLTTRSVFRATGGVSGHVALRFPKSELADVYVTTAKDLGSFTVHVTGEEHFSYEIADGEKVVAHGEAAGDFTLSTKGFGFWTPENPKRYTLRLRTANGSCEQKFGIRRLTTEGEGLRLNDRPVYLRGVTEHCYFAKTVHVPRDLDYYRMITRKRKELGFNFVRFHTFVPPVEYLEATDELGMLVQIESPNFVSEPEYAAIIAFARRHPSVVIYCTGNETRIDHLAEAYLRDVAEMVHTMSDAIFSPMSALRGIEYALAPGKDVIASEPFRHNAERMRRVAAYSDLFNSYQLAATSYSSLNGRTAETVDTYGDAYCGKPRLSHEICIDGCYIDLSLEKMYPAESPILKSGIFSKLRQYLAKRGVLNKADLYFRNSCEWMWRIRKHAFEKMRHSVRTAGYDFLGDINTHWHTFGYSVGMMDEFYRLKPGETVEDVRRYNSAAVILSDLGSDFNVTAGESKRVAFTISNFDDDAANARLVVKLCEAKGGRVVCEKRLTGLNVPCGSVRRLGEVPLDLPTSEMPCQYLLKASFEGGTVKAANEWELYAFPDVASKPSKGNLKIASEISESELLLSMRRGERVLLLGPGPFKSLPSTFRIGMAGRCNGDYATVIKAHPIFGGFPHDGYCGWQFRRLMEKGRTVQLEADVPFDPIVDVASSEKCVIRQSPLFEYRIGSGRLLVCSYNFGWKDPATAWLANRLREYAESEDFAPPLSLTEAQLHDVLSAPLIDGGVDSNVARNPNDPSSAVRADAVAQP